MKKLLFISIISILATFIIYSCQKNSTEKQQQTFSNLNLTSPNGKVLATSMEDLKIQMNPQIFRKFNSKEVSYTVESINYTTTKSGGMIADISYKTKEGFTTNMLIMDGVKGKINAHGNVKVIIDDNYSSSAQSNLVAKIKHSYSCSGGTCCKVHALEHPDGSVDVDCSCSGCSMTID